MSMLDNILDAIKHNFSVMECLGGFCEDQKTQNKIKNKEEMTGFVGLERFKHLNNDQG